MKLVIEHEPFRRYSADDTREYSVYLDGSNAFTDSNCLVARFANESEARRYCELRQQAKRIAEYDL